MDLIALHLLQVTRLLDRMLLHGLAVGASARRLPGHRPLIEAGRDDNGLERTAVRQQRDTRVTVSAEVRRR